MPCLSGSRRSPWVSFLPMLLALPAWLSPRVSEGQDSSARMKARVSAVRGAIGKYMDKGTKSGISSGLRAYLRAESSRDLDIFAKHDIHRHVVSQLKRADGAVVFETARGFLKKGVSTSFPAQVALLKAVVLGSGDVDESARTELFLKTAKSKHRSLSTWGVRFLAERRRVEGIDALIDLLETEERAGRYFGDLASTIQGELYRVLGSIAVGSAGQIRRAWERAGKNVPKKPDYSPGKSAGGGGKTVFFGDRIASRALFCIDLSSSMKGQVTVGGSSTKRPKVDIVKVELERAVSGLSPENRFNIILYDRSCTPWRSQGKLQNARSSTVKEAQQFARELETGSGTNIHDAMVLALNIDEVESIYLLSDGAPSVGGNAAQIRKRVLAMNYLSGVRVITYGFTGSDESLMRDLALGNWGWYRVLNK